MQSSRWSSIRSALRHAHDCHFLPLELSRSLEIISQRYMPEGPAFHRESQIAPRGAISQISQCGFGPVSCRLAGDERDPVTNLDPRQLCRAVGRNKSDCKPGVLLVQRQPEPIFRKWFSQYPWIGNRIQSIMSIVYDQMKAGENRQPDIARDRTVYARCETRRYKRGWYALSSMPANLMCFNVATGSGTKPPVPAASLWEDRFPSSTLCI